MRPLNRLYIAISRRVDTLLDHPESDFGVGIGLARATHVAAFIERTVDAFFENDKHDATPGCFARTVLEKIAYRLRNANLQPEEERFRDILGWKNVDKEKLRAEVRNNLLRLLNGPQGAFTNVGLELHVLLDMRMRYNAVAYISAFESSDWTEYPELAAVRDRLFTDFPELAHKAAA